MLAGDKDQQRLALLASYASAGRRSHGKEIDLGEGVVGQCAIEKRKILLVNVEGRRFRINTGLTRSQAAEVLVMPIVFEGELRGVVELASLESFSPSHQAFLDQLMESIGIVIHTIEANTRTENLLTQSQSLAEELQQTNQALEEKARQLAHQNQEVERKNTEVEQARQALEEKATQLALTSKYKSEFLANMSHELRTPLNSLLLLSDKLAKNPEGNLSLRQVESAKTIHASGNDLLALINDILDLSKIESGTVIADISELRLLDLQRYVERTFRHVAESKQVAFEVHLDSDMPRTMLTDIKRMQQIIKNLLSNAFKFTHEGSVSLTISAGGRRLVAGQRGSGGGRPGHRVFGHRHRYRHLARQAADHLRGVPAGRRLDVAQVRRHGPGARDQPRAVEAARRRDPARQRARRRAARSRCILPIEAPRASRVFAAERHRGAPRAGAEGCPCSRSTSRTTCRHRAATKPTTIARRIHPDDRTLLIVENDLAFAKVLLDAARRQGLQGARQRDRGGRDLLIKEYMPTMVSLDIFLPDMPGWRILDRLKADLSTRHIPICIVSTDDSRDRALSSGAIGFISKPVASTEVIDRAIAQLADYVARPRKKVGSGDGGRQAISRWCKSRLAEEAIDVVVTTETAEICELLRLTISSTASSSSRARRICSRPTSSRSSSSAR